MRRLLTRLLLAIVLVFAAAALVRGPEYARGLSFVVRAAGVQGPLLRASRIDTQPVVVDDVHPIVTRHGPVRSRVYRPARRTERAVVLVPGVNTMGVDEPRLAFFSRELAASGIAVATIELPDLMQFRVTPASVDVIEDAVQSLSRRPDVAPDGSLGLMGVSFAGGLSVVAAGRPSIRDRLAFVLSFGGHGDLSRALRYLCTGIEPSGPGEPPPSARAHHPPHDFGLALLALELAGRMVPPEQADPLRAGIRTFLNASHLDVIDKPAAGPLFEEARAIERLLPEPAASLLGLVNRRDTAVLGARLLPMLDAMAPPAVLSPERSDPPAAPVFLLHGTHDTVIPAVETRLLAHHLQGRTHVRYLLTDLINHAQIESVPAPLDVWKLVSFWTDVLDES